MTGDHSRWRRAQESARRGTSRGRRLVATVAARPVGRAVRRYLDANGNVLAGGIAYYSLASIAAALVLAVSVTSYIVVGNERYRDAVFTFMGNAIPGLFSTGDQVGLIDPDTLSPTPISGVVGAIAFGVLLFTATRYMRGMRAATRTMLGDASARSLPGALRDLVALVALAVIAVVAAGLQVVAGYLARFVADGIGSDAVTEGTVRIFAGIAGVAANVGFVALIFLWLGSARAPARTLVSTILVTAVVIAVLQQASGFFVGSASHNAVLAPFAAVIALLLFVDFTSRVLLVAAAWIGAASTHDPTD